MQPVTDSLSLDLSGSPAEIQRVSTAVRDFVSRHTLPPQTRFAVRLALEEAVSHALALGSDSRQTLTVHVEVTLDPSELVLRVEDTGPAFDPVRTAAPGQARGLGLHLTRALMDRLNYSHEGGRNVVVMRKRRAADTDEST
jgi:serine/threonine-protein kinase RsbW